MKCHVCGIEIKDANAKFCPKCGAKVEIIPSVDNTAQNVNEVSLTPKKKSKLPLILILVLVIGALIGVGGYFGYEYFIKGDKKETAENKNENTDSKYEEEDNNTYNTANEILTNEEYFGMLEDDWNSESDWYMFTVEDGSDVAVKFYFEEQYYEDTAYWDISIRSDSDPSENIAQEYVYGDVTETELEAFQLQEGTYYVVIESSNLYSSDEYSFEVVCED